MKFNNFEKKPTLFFIVIYLIIFLMEKTVLSFIDNLIILLLINSYIDKT